ncbi:hypothetical protein, partial [uncultured Campylobacter sp.]|uniref:hypothetical protein n=1 Tax=uncultured Campylobacter sp. TaxID=218934 RepID=UPI00262D36C7
MANYKISLRFKIYLFKYAASALSQTNSAMIQDITRGILAQNAALILQRKSKRASKFLLAEFTRYQIARQRCTITTTTRMPCEPP